MDEADERRNNHSDAALDCGRQLIAQGFPSPSGHQYECVPALQCTVYCRQLIGPVRVEAECLFELPARSLAVSEGLPVQLRICPIVTRLAQKPPFKVDFRFALAPVVKRVVMAIFTFFLPSSSLVYCLTPILYMLGALYNLPAWRRRLCDIGGGGH